MVHDLSQNRSTGNADRSSYYVSRSIVHIYRILMEAFARHLNIDLKSVTCSDWWRPTSTIFHAIMVGPHRVQDLPQLKVLHCLVLSIVFLGCSPLDAHRSTQVWKRDARMLHVACLCKAEISGGDAERQRLIEGRHPYALSRSG